MCESGKAYISAHCASVPTCGLNVYNYTNHSGLPHENSFLVILFGNTLCYRIFTHFPLGYI